MKPYTETSIELPQGKIFYRDQGTGTPVMFIHGVIANHTLWQPVLEAMSREVRCIAPDWPLGAHREPMHPDADLSIEGLMALIVAFIDRMALKDVVLVGNDSGGALVQMLAAYHPQRISGFVLTPCDTYETFPPFWFSYIKWLGKSPRITRLVARSLLLFPLLQRLPNAFGGLIDRPFSTKETAPWLEPMAESLAITRDMCRFISSANSSHTLAAAKTLQSSRLSALLLWSENNPFFRIRDAQRLVRDIPDSRLESIEGKCTFISMDHPEWMARHIESFTRTVRLKASENTGTDKHLPEAV